ncbi:MAG: glycosyltransferase family 39 protein [Verrucomicrobiota bacterium]
MDVSLPGNLLTDKRTLWLVGALAVVLFLLTNLPWQLDDYDQAKQAYTSFEMVKDGHWFYQQTPHEHVATKPPLIGWISAGLFAITRSWDVAWRLPSLLAAIAMAILLFRTANSAYGSIAGLIALSAFGLNMVTLRLATLVRTDMPLALAIFLIGLLIWQKIRTRAIWNDHDRRSVLALLTAAMLIKGPIVYAFLLPGIALFQWRASGGTRAVVSQIFGRRQRGRPPLNEKSDTPGEACSAWSGWRPWLLSLGIFLVWVIGGIIFQTGFFNQVVMREFVGRFGETIHRPQPFYFYLPHLLHKFAPWSLLMIALAVIDLRSAKWKVREAFRQMSPETFWLICWSLGGLLAMSLIPSKRVDRIFPVIPPLCLLLAAQIANWEGRASARPRPAEAGPSDADLADAENEDARGRVYLWSAIVLVASILFTSVYTMSKVVTGYRDQRDALVVFGHQVRDEADKHHWRYEAVTADDEGLLLYLRRPHFLKPDRAVAEWNGGYVDALVVPGKDAPALMRQLHDAALSELKSAGRKDERGLGYVLITR